MLDSGSMIRHFMMSDEREIERQLMDALIDRGCVPGQGPLHLLRQRQPPEWTGMTRYSGDPPEILPDLIHLTRQDMVPTVRLPLRRGEL